MEKCVYSDDEIEVYHCTGNASYQLITFSEMGMAAGQGAWGAMPLRKLGIPYIGFVSKTPNWFPEKNIKLALNTIGDLIAEDLNVILYGFSQGGYAALRYANLFRATAVLSFAPQYSIDPQAMNGVDMRFSQYHRTNYNHREIQSVDVDRSVFAIIFYDPWDILDNINAEYITKELPNAQSVMLYGTGHQIIRCFSSSIILNNLIEFTINRNLSGVKGMSLQAKRSWDNRLEFLVRSMARINSKRAIRFIRDNNYDFNTEATKETLEALYAIGEIGFFADVLENLLQRDDIAYFKFKSLLNGNRPCEASVLLNDITSKEIKNECFDDLELYYNASQIFLNEDLTLEYGSVRVPSRQIMFGSGWHSPEAWGAWSSSLSSTLYVKNITLDEHVLSGHISYAFAGQTVEIYAEIDGQELEIPLVDNHFSLRYQGATSMRFIVNGLRRSGDIRLLGAGVTIDDHRMLEAQPERTPLSRPWLSKLLSHKDRQTRQQS